ncbi:integrin alpha-6 isoform X2 [Latimeria chalumnae]|nr:PREDICTED: integrin alpha-6 isoform X2 [Latimeria chalumnae]|eukprot:XP_006010755.1 PREDICTED: integrin alpha-6 isoform X2 [Latimeria chalumnae]
MALAERLLFLYLAFFCHSQWTFISAFNLDLDNVIKKTGDPDSLFGFSLAMHRQLHPVDKRILLVGAPRAKALPRQRANVTGGLYSCDVSSNSQTCTRVDFDNEDDPTKESKENQWMGVTVQSQGPGGKIVTCAHRYEKRMYVTTPQESRDVIGRCYILSEDLTINNDDEMDGGRWTFCDGRPRGHEKFGSCQQGVAATFTRDFHYVIFGAPGTYNWKGDIRVEQKNSTMFELGYYDDGPFEVADESEKNEMLIPVPANSYLGFSLDSGVGITSKDHMTFVSGAPRANHSGAVVLLKKIPDFPRRLVPEHVFYGEGLASSFGYDVTVVDLNNDGWQDIVVGAPQYFDREGEIGGAVYVYINKEGKWNKVKPVRLNGTKDSMFGLTVENIGDINQDSYQDIAVGAPYDDNGKVYIYNGLSTGINTRPAQVLTGKGHNIQFFGYSLAGNMDLDGNTYPDIAVGSLSDSLFVYRSRPVISIKKSITTSPSSIDLKQKTCSDGIGICMNVKACFSYTANPNTYSPTITIAYEFEAEADRRKLGLPSRVTFSNQGNNALELQHKGTLDLKGQNSENCKSVELRLQENFKDVLRPIPITVSVNIKEAKRKKRQDNSLPDLAPILNSNEPNTVHSEVHFQKEGCGSDNVCQSNLQLSYRFCTKEDKPERFLPLPLKDDIPVFSLSDQKNIALEISVTNGASDPQKPQKDGDDAYEAKLIADFPETLSYSAYRGLSILGDKQLCSANENGSRAECDLGNPLTRGSSVKFYLILSTQGISLDTTDLDIKLQLETTSNQTNLAPITAKAQVVIELLLSVSGVAKPSQVYFGGSVLGESAMKTEDDIGSLIEYEFRIINLGKPLTTLGTTSLNIQWPKEIHNGKWLLYLVKIDSKGLDEITCEPANEINPRQVEDSTGSRRKREVGAKDDDDQKISLFSNKRKYLTIDCNADAKCVNIKCPLKGLDSNAFIVLRSRLWNSTFLEEYSKMNYLDIIVRAAINVNTTAKNILVKDARTQVRVTVFPEKATARYTGMPWWIILVAILAGILMLALLVFLLWKCGFFRKSKKDHYDATYHKAESHVQPSDKERLTTDAMC